MNVITLNKKKDEEYAKQNIESSDKQYKVNKLMKWVALVKTITIILYWTVFVSLFYGLNLSFTHFLLMKMKQEPIFCILTGHRSTGDVDCPAGEKVLQRPADSPHVWATSSWSCLLSLTQ